MDRKGKDKQQRKHKEGQAYADGAGIVGKHSILSMPPRKVEGERIFISGNDAAAMGFMVAGGRFFAGYPITPATDVMNFLAGNLPAGDGSAAAATHGHHSGAVGVDRG